MFSVVILKNQNLYLKVISWFSVNVKGSKDGPQSRAKIWLNPHLHLWCDHNGIQVPELPHSSSLAQDPDSIR